MADPMILDLDVELADGFWAPRQAQLRNHTLPVLLERFEAHGIIDNFRRLAPEAPPMERQGLWFSDSDVYKWMEAAAWAGRTDLLDPVIDAVQHAAHPDGYLHTFYDVGAAGRYRDLSTSHELYCGGHFVEAALAHYETTGDRTLLDLAMRWADHVCETFGPGRDERVDGHPEAELALARLARVTGAERHLAQARWTIEHQLAATGLTIDTVELAGHAVKALYLASGIAEVAAATHDPRWTAVVERLFASLVDEHSYPTGAIGGRWLDESIGRPYEQPDEMSYTESCAAVAAVQLCRRVWDLTGDPRALDQIELLLYNAVPCGVGADGESWFYSQPHGVAEVAAETNPWALPFEYGQQMLLSWFPARRHRWFDVLCCPPNLARMFATAHHHMADLDDHGDLRIHLPVAGRIRGGGWDVSVRSPYPDDGQIDVEVRTAPPGGTVLSRRPGWAGGRGHDPVPEDGRIDLPVAPEWWESHRWVEGGSRSVFLRSGPVVHCVEGIDLPDVDIRDLVVDPTGSPEAAFARIIADGGAPLHQAASEPVVESVSFVPFVPYHAWANRGPTTMRIRFPRS